LSRGTSSLQDLDGGILFSVFVATAAVVRDNAFAEINAIRNVIGNKPEPVAGMAFEAACGLRTLGLHTSIIVYRETVVRGILLRGSAFMGSDEITAPHRSD
jgi:hypothetical protein